MFRRRSPEERHRRLDEKVKRELQGKGIWGWLNRLDKALNPPQPLSPDDLEFSMQNPGLRSLMFEASEGSDQLRAGLFRYLFVRWAEQHPELKGEEAFQHFLASPELDRDEFIQLMPEDARPALAEYWRQVDDSRWDKDPYDRERILDALHEVYGEHADDGMGRGTPEEAEAVALKEHLEYALYPEMADDIDAVQRAITAMAEGRAEEKITFASGWVEEAAMVCAVLDLESFVSARIEGDGED